MNGEQTVQSWLITAEDSVDDETKLVLGVSESESEYVIGDSWIDVRDFA